MYFDAFNKLAEMCRKEGRNDDVSPSVKLFIQAEYSKEYLWPGKKSSDIVRKLCEKFPRINVPEVLRSLMDHTRA